MPENVNVENKTMVREPLLAGMLSFVVMGLGQAYNGERRKGYLLIILTILCTLLLFDLVINVFKVSMPKEGQESTASSLTRAFFNIPYFFIWLFSIVDAYRTAKKINNENIDIEEASGRSVFIFFRNVFLVLISSLAFAIIIPLSREYIFKVFLK